MLKSLIILLFTFTSSVVRGLTRYDNNTCFDKKSRDYYCCASYEEINGICIKCKLGFMSRKGDSCEPCGFEFFGKDCTLECMCNNLQRCDNVNGCVDINTRSSLTTTSIIAEAISSEESVTKVHEEQQIDGLSKTELLILLCGALSGIIVLLGVFGISNCVKKRICISKSGRKKTIEEGDNVEEQASQESFELHESLYESIDDSNLDNTLLPHTSTSYLEKDDDSSSSESISKCNEDRASYLQPFSSSITEASSYHQDEERPKAIPSDKKDNCIVGKSSCSPYPSIEEDASGYEVSVDCTYDRATYLHRNNASVDKTSYCHISDIDKSAHL
ncbi:uncharacterized protein LOC143074671 [Mytilus galloprovincialis]|uniref:uncharacterized protein LOC143074671 n=1 Tax=Mytilus galloprovincialis TaxID=29158 RepID=UPI003F7C8922